MVDDITGQGIQGRRLERFSRACAETGVMPRAAHDAFLEYAFRQRTPVVRTACSDREELLTVARQQDRLAIRVAEEHSAGLQGVGGNPCGKVRPGQLRLCVAHVVVESRL